jgi:hypothetical protein
MPASLLRIASMALRAAALAALAGILMKLFGLAPERPSK